MAKYFCSDLHGEYSLFLKLLDKCNIGNNDTIYILGDIIDKGKNGFALLDFVMKQKNFKAICGNHEHVLLKHYYNCMQEYNGNNEDDMLKKIRAFSANSNSLTWEMLDFLDSLPYFIEEEDFVCVHAGLNCDKDGRIIPLSEQKGNTLVYDRNFKEKNIIPNIEKVVLFGHTPCCYENATGEFIKTLKRGISNGKQFCDYAKIRLDTGVFLTNMLGMLRKEDMQEFYVKK